MLKVLNRFKKKGASVINKNLIYSLNISRYNEAFGRILIDAVDTSDNTKKYYILLIDEKRFNPDVFKDVNHLFLYKKSCRTKTIIFAKVKDNFRFKNKKSFQIKVANGLSIYKKEHRVFKMATFKVVSSLGCKKTS